MEKSIDRYYIVHESALPEGMRRVCLAQRLLMQGQVKTVTAAVKKAGISRSIYYKYRDSIRPYSQHDREDILTLQAVLENRAGVLSNFLNAMARWNANVLTVNQNVPVGGVAGISLSVNTAGMKIGRESLVQHLTGVNGVVSVAILLEE